LQIEIITLKTPVSPMTTDILLATNVYFSTLCH